jgi:hypothetical protein
MSLLLGDYFAKADQGHDDLSDADSDYFPAGLPDAPSGTFLSTEDAMDACQAEHYIFAKCLRKPKPGSYFEETEVGSSFLLLLHGFTPFTPSLRSTLRHATAPTSTRK